MCDQLSITRRRIHCYDCGFIICVTLSFGFTRIQIQDRSQNTLTYFLVTDSLAACARTAHDRSVTPSMSPVFDECVALRTPPAAVDRLTPRLHHEALSIRRRKRNEGHKAHKNSVEMHVTVGGG